MQSWCSYLQHFALIYSLQASLLVSMYYNSLIICTHLMIIALCGHSTIVGHLLRFRPVTSLPGGSAALTFRKRYEQHTQNFWTQQGGSGLSAAFCPVVIYSMYGWKVAAWLRIAADELCRHVAARLKIFWYSSSEIKLVEWWYHPVQEKEGLQPPVSCGAWAADQCWNTGGLL